MDCTSLPLLEGVQLVYWSGLLVSTVSVLFVPTLRQWHRYGKLRSASQNWLDSFTVPKHWFMWFYMLGFLWTLILLGSQGQIVFFVTGFICVENSPPPGAFHFLPLGLYLLHVGRRLNEEWSAPKSAARMHVLGGLVGLSFYGFAPLALLWASFSTQTYQPHLLGLGVVVFWKASEHQVQVHAGLQGSKKSSPNKYVLPRSAGFSRSSNPHYFAEMLIYVSFFLVFPLHSDVRFWVLTTTFTIANLCITGARTHQWYLERFGDEYSKEKRARVIPFVF
jgi:3-oxo-5-alpha-steroid 4-dehydrogenase 3